MIMTNLADADAPTLILSNRNCAKDLAEACLFEFEDILAEVQAVDFITPPYRYSEGQKRMFFAMEKVVHSPQLARRVLLDQNSLHLQRDYEHFFCILLNPSGSLYIDIIENLRERCQKLSCYLIEAWQKDIQFSQPTLKLLKKFDHIFIGVKNVVEGIEKITGRPCTYLPPAVDTLRFFPDSFEPRRCIDLNYMGRRSEVTHNAVLKITQARDFFYYYDSCNYLGFKDYKQHRDLFANLLKRSSYFIANRANANEPEKTQGYQEIGYRFFEGAAAGTVMLGDYPKTETFDHYFDWQDAVIDLPFDSPDIERIINDLNAQPKRLTEIRRNNVINCLKRHDWIYRWRTILETVGLPVTEGVTKREESLKALAAKV